MLIRVVLAATDGPLRKRLTRLLESQDVLVEVVETRPLALGTHGTHGMRCGIGQPRGRTGPDRPRCGYCTNCRNSRC